MNRAITDRLTVDPNQTKKLTGSGPRSDSKSSVECERNMGDGESFLCWEPERSRCFLGSS